MEDEVAECTKAEGESPSPNYRMNPPGEAPAGYPGR